MAEKGQITSSGCLLDNHPKTAPQVTDTSGAVKITYDLEDEEDNTKPSALHTLKDKLKDKLAHQTVPGPDSSVLNTRQSAGGSQETRTTPTTTTTTVGGSPQGNESDDSGKKVSRGEELGTGYEADSDSPGPVT